MPADCSSVRAKGKERTSKPTRIALSCVENTGILRGRAAAKLIGEATIIPIHYEGWTHLTEGHDEIERAFAAAGLEKHLLFLSPGQPVSINI